MTLTPTPEQAEIVHAAKTTQDNLIINALAGSAKTTTLEMVANAITGIPILSLAFNKRIASEMEKRLPSYVVCKTLNSIGHGVWAAACGKKLTVDTKKSYNILKTIIDDMSRRDAQTAYESFADTLQWIGKAKRYGYVPAGVPVGTSLQPLEDDDGEPDDPALVDEALRRSITASYAGVIDFDDQLYMPCQPAGTMVRTKAGEIPIELIQKGDEVISFDRKTSKFIGDYNHGSAIAATESRQYTGKLFHISSAGFETQATLEHKWLVRFRPGLEQKSLWVTYLMQKGQSFKLGQSQIRSVRPGGTDGFGLSVRCATDKGEKAWVLAVHNSLQEAKLAEAVNVMRFGITDCAFTSDIGEAVHQIQQEFSDLYERVEDCLNYYGRSFRHPFYYSYANRSFTNNFIVESCNLIEDIMEIPIYRGHKEADWQRFSIGSEYVKDLTVYSLKVARHELYIANNILTHNCLFGGAWPRFPLVLVDEAQDLSPINHEMLAKLATRRLIAVGDPWQSIYGFRGAVANGMAALQQRFGCRTLTLSTSFRCPRSVVRLARSRVPHMNWPEWAEEGETRELNIWDSGSIPDGAAIICRNNAPLFSCGLRLLASGRGVKLVGFDIGPGLVRILKKLGPESMPEQEALWAIDRWRDAELARKRKGTASIYDRAECLAVFITGRQTLGAAIGYAEHLFASSGPILLMSGHKSKGLEFDEVFHLDPWRIPSQYAPTEGEGYEQELNVEYVVRTRAKKRYTEITMEGFQ